MLAEPLVDVDVNVPGVMAILVAPVALQLSVLVVPELMVDGLAIKDAIAGAAPFPDPVPDEIPEPQPASTTPANRVRTRAQRSSLEKLAPRGQSLLP